MLSSAIPTKFGIPFANGATGSNIRPIPVASQIGIQPGAASLTDGFPPVTFIAVSSGGTPPWGADWNGILNQTSAWNRWQAAGGPVHWDSAFSATIGGYPSGSTIMSTANALKYWVSTVDNNTTNPDSGGANWMAGYLIPFTPVQQGTGVSQLSNVVKLGWDGAYLRATVDATDLGPLASQSWANGQFYTKTYTDANYATYNWVNANFHTASYSDATYATYAWVGANYAGLWLFANSTSINGYQRLPGGMIIQWGNVDVTGNGGLTQWGVNFPISFPTFCAAIVANWGGVNPPVGVTIAASSPNAWSCIISVQGGPAGNVYATTYMAYGF
jgi:hypothetical protein